MGSGRYASCTIDGEGILYTENNKFEEKFLIIDMTAIGIMLETSAILQENTKVKLKIWLMGSPVEVHIDLVGRVISKIKKGYEIEFLDLSSYDREEIDELMKSTCNIE